MRRAATHVGAGNRATHGGRHSGTGLREGGQGWVEHCKKNSYNDLSLYCLFLLINSSRVYLGLMNPSKVYSILRLSAIGYIKIQRVHHDFAAVFKIALQT